jgi:hypothetical protein
LLEEIQQTKVHSRSGSLDGLWHQLYLNQGLSKAAATAMLDFDGAVPC